LIILKFIEWYDEKNIFLKKLLITEMLTVGLYFSTVLVSSL